MRPSPEPTLRHGLASAILILALFGCAEADHPGGDEASMDDPAASAEALPSGAQARSFLGEALFPPPLGDELEANRRADLATAEAELHGDPDDPELWIWVGRRQAYLGLYREAIETFSEGLERFPDDPRFLRHRGHRFLSVREPARAEADLDLGLAMARNAPDEIEPDGLPNPQGIPLTTLHFNLWYHLGLARYIQGDWEGAAQAWAGCMEVSTNPDLRVATGYWLYLTRQRLGLDDEARALLVDLPESDEIIENDSYLHLLEVFAGERDPDSLVNRDDPDSLGAATVAYGIAMHHLFEGRDDDARAVMQRVLDQPNQWAAFGYMAAEAQVARAGW